VSSAESDPPPSAATPPKRKRVRDPEAHRAAILEAARAVFGERGYRSGTIREIAGRAGVTHGLVVRHFETKDQLFVAALLDGRRSQPPTAGNMSGLPERVARAYVEQIEADGPSDPFIALIRSAGDADIAKQLLRAMRMEPAAAYLAVLDTPDLERRGDLLGALLIGVTFTRYILADGPLAMMSSENLIAYLTPLVRGILLDPLPESGAGDTAP
jgi:AcrR family transcriptional regulator